MIVYRFLNREIFNVVIPAEFRLISSPGLPGGDQDEHGDEHQCERREHREIVDPVGESVLRELANAGDAVYGFSEILVTSDVIGGTGVVRGHDVVRAFSCLDGFDGTEGAVAVGGEDDVGGLELLHVDLLDDDDIGLFDVRGHGVVADGVAAKAADGGVGHVVGEESDHAADGCEEQDQGQDQDQNQNDSQKDQESLREKELRRKSEEQRRKSAQERADADREQDYREGDGEGGGNDQYDGKTW